MKAFISSLVFLIGYMAVGATLSFAQPTTFVDKGEGKALVADLLNRIPEENNEILGLLKIRPGDAEPIEVPVKMTTQVSSNGWQDTYETKPVIGRPKEVLTIKHEVGKPNSYFFGSVTNQSENAKPALITAKQLYLPFAGSDFCPADLGLEFLHWPTQKILKKEMRKGRSCRVVESINAGPRSGGYLRVLSWIDYETGGIIRAEGYDQNNILLKEFSIRAVDRKEHRLKEIEIRNDQTDSRTRLEFNLEIKADLSE